jgi:hypothetical protein
MYNQLKQKKYFYMLAKYYIFMYGFQILVRINSSYLLKN